MLDLSSVNAKIKRGYEHLYALNAEVETWLHRHPYGLRTEVQDEGRRHIGWLDVYSQPDATRFGLLIGDSAHNFRAALDHLVVAIASVNLPAARLAKAEMALEYPICTTRSAWKSAVRRGRLEGVGRRACTKILREQPYRTGNPAEHDLAVLSWLDNRDKHRLVHAIAAYPTIQSVNLSPPINPVAAEITAGPYEDGAQIYRVSIDPPSRDVQVSADIGVQIQVRDLTRPEDVRVSLVKIGGLVQSIVADVAKAHATD
jgi:hypothetical protein